MVTEINSMEFLELSVLYDSVYVHMLQGVSIICLQN